jgi:hypothetical protein
MDSTSSTNSTGAMTAILNIAAAFPDIALFITYLFGFIGVVMIGNGIKGFYDIEKHGTYAHGGYQNRTAFGLVWRVLIGGVLTMGAWGIGIVGNTIFGSQVASGSMSYSAAGLSATQQAAVQAVFACFALTGYIAFGHGWMLMDQHTSGRSNSGWKAPLVFIVAGTALVYMQQVMSLISDVTGINVVNMLVF